MGIGNIIVTFVAAIAFLSFCSNAQQGIGEAVYGGKCKIDSTNDSEICNRAKHFTCVEINATSICQCEKHADGISSLTMKYDSTLEKCISLAGKYCIESVSDGQFPTTCVKNSVCNQPEGINKPGLCECLMGYIEVEGIGECRLGFNGANCTTHTDCNTNAFLKCGDDSRCVCDQELAEWNPTANQCQGLVGAVCEANKPCSATGNMGCTNMKCACTANFTEDPSDHKCYKPYDAVCAIDKGECHPIFECKPNATKCGCPDGQTYQAGADGSFGSCVLLAGLTCIPEENNCVQHSSCHTNTSTCECDNGFTKDADNFCRGSLGTTCGDNDICSTNSPLVCKGGSCNCKDNYEVSNNICVGLYGAGCEGSSDCKSPFECNKVSANDTEGTCSCPGGTALAPGNTTCLLSYGAECGESSGMECNRYNYLACNYNTMQCDCEDDTLIYQPSQSTSRCLSKADYPCQSDLDRPRQCVGNSSCITDNPQGDGTGVCKCNAGFNYSPDSNGQCFSGAMGPLQGSVSLASLLLFFAVAFSNKN